MEAFAGSCLMQTLQEFSMDIDILSLSQASRQLRQDIALHAAISFETPRGTMTWSEDGISGLCRFYPLSKLGQYLRELAIGTRPLHASYGRGQIQMQKEEGFGGQSLQSTQCQVLMESYNNMPMCKWEVANGDKCACRIFVNSPSWPVEHCPECQAVESAEGYVLTLHTLSKLFFHLQGEIIIHCQKNFNMWHEVLHEIGCFPRYEGPMLCRSFEFDQKDAQAMMKHRWEGDFPQRCTSELVEFYLEPHGECGVEVGFESVEDGLLVFVWLSKKTGDDKYEIIERVDTTQVCGDIGVYDPQTSSFGIFDSFTFHYSVTTEDDVAHDVAWLPATWDLYPYVRDALIFGRPLPMLLSNFEQA